MRTKNNTIHRHKPKKRRQRYKYRKPAKAAKEYRSMPMPEAAEDEFLQSEKRYKNLAESLSEVVYRADPRTFSPIYVNRAIENFYGYSVEEWVGDPNLWKNTIHPDDKEKVLLVFDEAAKNLQNACVEYRILRKDKTILWIDNHFSWERDEQGNVVSLNGIMYDISRRKREEKMLLASQEGVKDFYRKILMGQEQEKKRIARDLHDETGQIVIALGASLNIVEKEIKEGNIEKALAVLEGNRKQIQEIANKMKSMAITLRPPALDILGLSAVLREYFSQCTNLHPIKIGFDENIKDVKLNEEIEIALYRIVQEAIYNILKHASATTANVNLTFTKKELQLSIEDDGKGFDVEEHNKQSDISKMGLRGIKERVSILNGSFSIDSALGKGTKLAVVLPLNL